MNPSTYTKDRKRLSELGRRGALASAGRNEVIRRPGKYSKLYTIRIENHTSGQSQEIVIMQGDRSNNYMISCFGRCTKRAMGIHRVMTEIAKRLVVRWMQD